MSTRAEGCLRTDLWHKLSVESPFLGRRRLLHEIEFPEWSDANDSKVYIGPNASFRYKRFWVTGSALLQVTGISEEPELQLRAIFSAEL